MTILAISFVLLVSTMALGQTGSVVVASCSPETSCDIGSAINAAYNNLPSTGGRIRVPAGLWSLQTTAACNRSSKPCVIEGDPHGGTTITTAGFSGTAFCLDWGTEIGFETLGFGDQILGAGGIRDITILGPSAPLTPPHTGESGIGVEIGSCPTTANGAFGVVLSGVSITSFFRGVDLEHDAFNVTIENSAIISCEQGVYQTDSENDRILNSSISRNHWGIEIVGKADVHSFGVSYDDNSGVDASGAAVYFHGNDLTSSYSSYADHYENIGGGSARYILSDATYDGAGGLPRLYFYGGTMLDDVSSGPPLGAYIDCANSAFSAPTCDTVYIGGTEFWSNGRQASQLLRAFGAESVFLSPVILTSLVENDCTDCSKGRYFDFPVRGPGTPNWSMYANLTVKGTLTASSKLFKIDDPLDPENKYLLHTSVESPDMMNIYNGNIKTDQHGLATISLPPYFEALNRDFRYQLTVIGQFSKVSVIKEVHDNKFTIRTSKPGVRVSWQVTGIRHDDYANTHRANVEEDKPLEERRSSNRPAKGESNRKPQ